MAMMSDPGDDRDGEPPVGEKVPGALLEEPTGLLLQIGNAWRENSGNGQNVSWDQLHDFLPHIINSTLLGNANQIIQQTDMKSRGELAGIYTAYSVVFFISFIANFLVCYVIIKNKRFRSVTYALIANLSVSDLMITIFNIPFNLMRFTMRDWIFGEFICKLTSLTLMCAIYVSTFTMAAIALDRYLVILYPLRPRLTFSAGIVIVVVTWVIGVLMSLPFPMFARVERVDLLLISANRCNLVYPEPADDYARYFTLATFIAQFVLPMSLSGVAYGQIVQKLWSRQLLGQTTDHQKLNHEKTRRRTIKMLIVVILVFVLCWLPLNLYHILTDFHPDRNRFSYNSTAFLACHWVAISSCCYNPFIYCWFNNNFRQVLRSLFRRKQKRNICLRPGIDIDKTRENRTVKSSKYKILERMRIGSGHSRSSGTKSTLRSKSSSKRARNPRMADHGIDPAKNNQPVLNTIWYPISPNMGKLNINKTLIID